VSPLANLELEERSGFAIARVGGEVDASNMASLREDILAGISNQVTGVILDLSPTSYLDSAGVHLIFELARRLRQRQLGFGIVVAPGTIVADVLEMVRIEDTASCAQDVDGAIEELSRPSERLPQDREAD
jgi:anti-anti-sigma factor